MSLSWLAIAEETVTLDYHPLEQAVLQLREQYVVGMLEVKVVK